MPYLVVNGLPVFLHWDLWRETREKALAGKSPEFRVASMIHGHPENREGEELMEGYLARACRDDALTFWTEFVHFDLRGKAAQENTWDVIHDFCDLFRCGWTCDLRDERDTIVDDLTGDGYTYPHGREFALVVGARPRGLLARLVSPAPRPLASIRIDCARAIRIAGWLTAFELSLDHMTIGFRGAQVSIDPAPASGVGRAPPSTCNDDPTSGR